MIFIIKVTTNKEDKAIEMISERVQKKNLNVYCIARPHGLKGYIILESEDRESAEEAAFNLPYVKGILGKEVAYLEVQNMLEPKVEEMNIKIGDIVEIIAQSFKGEHAKVSRIDTAKGEVVVSLLGASVPIPVTVKIDNVKVIRREDERENEEKTPEEVEEDSARDFADELEDEL